jgi:guanylate kinase
MIFIRTPDGEILRQRLVNRKTESEDLLARRLERVPMELEMGKAYEHQVINDNLDIAVKEVDTIIREYLNNNHKGTLNGTQTGRS